MGSFRDYSELLLEAENSSNYEYVLYYENSFSVVRNRKTNRWYYFEEAENDASTFFEVFPVARLEYPPDTEPDFGSLHGLFVSVCCGEHTDENGNTSYMWFGK